MGAPESLSQPGSAIKKCFYQTVFFPFWLDKFNSSTHTVYFGGPLIGGNQINISALLIHSLYTARARIYSHNCLNAPKLRSLTIDLMIETSRIPSDDGGSLDCNYSLHRSVLSTLCAFCQAGLTQTSRVDVIILHIRRLVWRS